MTDSEGERTGVRSNSKTTNDLWLGSGVSEFSADSTSDLEVSTPPLAVISSRIKSPGSLANCVNPGALVVRYNYDSTTLAKLHRAVAEKLKGRQALSIAFLMHGHPGCFKICSQKVVNCNSLREDVEIRDFLLNLVSSFMNQDSRYARIDLLLCPVAANQEGVDLLHQMKVLLKVPVFASSDILGDCIVEDEGGRCEGREGGGVRIGTLYFDRVKLKDWTGQAQQTLDLFEKIKEVGKGAYGSAILYRKKDDNSLVVLKETNLMELKRAERQLALNEIQILSMLDHPNIISYYDSFEQEGVLMIEMEYADGGTLAQLLRQQQTPFNEQEILRWFSQMVDALKYLHDHKILHRDLKTANIFLTKDRIVKLGDFGISKVLAGTNQEANTVLGTPYYISPEICEGKNYNAKSDIWALGCVLYEMACLERTFEGTNFPALIHKIVQVSFAPIKGDYSDGFKALIEEMLQKDPFQRPSASEICSARLPLLMEDHDELALAPEDEGTAMSFLYYLDGQSLLLKPVFNPIETKIDHVAVGYSHLVAVTCHNTVFSWGEGSRGQLGHGNSAHCSTPQLIEALKNRTIVRAECGGEFSVFVSDNGILMSCGRGDKGALGHGDFTDALKPRLIETLLSYDVAAVSCGEGHVVTVMSDCSVFAWGNGGSGRLGTGSENNQSSPVAITVQSGRMREVVTDVRCGVDGSMFLTDTGRLFACGSNQDNKLGLNQRETFIANMRRILNRTQLQVPLMTVATPIKDLGKHRVIDVSLGPTHSCVLVETGQVYSFGRNAEGQLCAGNCQQRSTPVVVQGIATKPTMVKCSELATIVTTSDNSFLIWGSRPIIKSPLTEFLAPPVPPEATAVDKDEVFNDSAPTPTPVVMPTPLSPISIELDSSNISVSSGHLASSESTPERKAISSENVTGKRSEKRTISAENITAKLPGKKTTSSENITGKLPETVSSENITGRLGQKTESGDSVNRLSTRLSAERVDRRSSINLLEVPFAMFPCADSAKYLQKLMDTLQEALDASRTSKSLKRDSVSSGRGLNRGHASSSSSCDIGSPEGVIMKPTLIDLVGKCGILSSLSAQGLRNAKLECVSCFGSNVVVVIEAVEAGLIKEGAESHKSVQPFLKISRKITERRRKVPTPQWPHSTESSPVLTRKTPSSVSDHVSLPAVLPEASFLARASDATLSGDSEVASWLKKDLDEALNSRFPSVKPHLLEVKPHPLEASLPCARDDVTVEGNGVNSKELIPSNENIGMDPTLTSAKKTEGTPVQSSSSNHTPSSLGSCDPTTTEDSNTTTSQSSTKKVFIVSPRRLTTATSTSSLASLRQPLNLKKASSTAEVHTPSHPSQPSHPHTRGSVTKQSSNTALKSIAKQPNPPRTAAGKTLLKSKGNSDSSLSSSGGLKSPPGGGLAYRKTTSGVLRKPGKLPPIEREPNISSPRSFGADEPVESGIESMSPQGIEQLSSSSEGEVFLRGSSSRPTSTAKTNPGVKSVAMAPNKRLSRVAKTGHVLPVAGVSPYAEPAPRIQKTSKIRERSTKPVAKQQDDQSKEAKLLAEQEDEKQSYERQQRALAEKHDRQSAVREAQLQGEIDQLRSEVAKQGDVLQENLEVMKLLQKQVEQLQPDKTPPTSPQRGRRPFRLRGIRSARRGSRDEDSMKSDSNRTKSTICSVM